MKKKKNCIFINNENDEKNVFRWLSNSCICSLLEYETMKKDPNEK